MTRLERASWAVIAVSCSVLLWTVAADGITHLWEVIVFIPGFGATIIAAVLAIAGAYVKW